MARKRKSAVASRASVVVVQNKTKNSPPSAKNQLTKMPTTLKGLKDLVAELQTEKQEVSASGFIFAIMAG